MIDYEHFITHAFVVRQTPLGQELNMTKLLKNIGYEHECFWHYLINKDMFWCVEYTNNGQTFAGGALTEFLRNGEWIINVPKYAEYTEFDNRIPIRPIEGEPAISIEPIDHLLNRDPTPRLQVRLVCRKALGPTLDDIQRYYKEFMQRDKTFDNESIADCDIDILRFVGSKDKDAWTMSFEYKNAPRKTALPPFFKPEPGTLPWCYKYESNGLVRLNMDRLRPIERMLVTISRHNSADSIASLMWKRAKTLSVHLGKTVAMDVWREDDCLWTKVRWLENAFEEIDLMDQDSFDKSRTMPLDVLRRVPTDIMEKLFSIKKTHQTGCGCNAPAPSVERITDHVLGAHLGGGFYGISLRLDDAPFDKLDINPDDPNVLMFENREIINLLHVLENI